MFLISTTANNASILRAAIRLLTNSPSDAKTAMEMADIVRLEKCPWYVRFCFSNAIYDHEPDCAKRFIDGFDFEEFFYAENIVQMNFMVRVFIRIGCCDEVLALLKSLHSLERFDSSFVRNFSFNVIIEVLRIKNDSRAIQLLSEIDLSESLINFFCPEQLTALIEVLVRNGQSIRAMKILKQTLADSFLSDKISLKVAYAMLLKNKIHQAESLIEKIDAKRFIEQAANATEIRFLFNLMIYGRRGGEVHDLIKEMHDLATFKELESKDYYLSLAHMLIGKGKKKDAYGIILSLESGIVPDSENVIKFLSALLRLRMFKKLDLFFAKSKEKGSDHYDFSGLRAMHHRCQWQFNLASESFETRHLSKADNFSRVHAFARVLNCLGKHMEAKALIEPYLKLEKFSIADRSSFLIEKAISLRSMGEFGKALACFDEIIKINNTVNQWVWMADFEYALTSFFIADICKAIMTAHFGMKKKSFQLSTDQNPCIFLFAFLKDGETIKRCSEFACAFAKAWSFPHFPYHIIATVFSVIASHRLNEPEKANSAMNLILEQVKGRGLKEVKKQLVILLARNRKVFLNQEIIRLLGELLWPNHAESSYERNIIFKLAAISVQ